MIFLKMNYRAILAARYHSFGIGKTTQIINLVAVIT